MAHYFFNLHECGHVTVDLEGMERANLEEAREEALRAARGVMCAELAEGRLCLSCRVEVQDGTGALVLELPFEEAVTITGSRH